MSLFAPLRFPSVSFVAAMLFVALPSGAAPLISPAAGSDAILGVAFGHPGRVELKYHVERTITA